MDELVECPVCGVFLDAGAEAEAHVAAHFAASQDAERAPSGRAAGAASPLAGSQPNGGTGLSVSLDAGVMCAECGAAVALAELDSHEEAHRLQQLEAGARQAEAREREAAEHAEAQQFAALQQMYGFSDKPPERPGSCFLCGQPGHWAAECPKDPGRIGAVPRLPTEPRALASQQRREPSALADADVVPLLRAALISELRAHTSVFLCGFAAHLSRARQDSGWGCGYRNCQMLSSYLLAKRPDARAALFGGCGWLPDIPSLQAWLEAAWDAGFDPPGRQQLGGGVQATPKWIGTPEVAVVLRQFGLDARLVDFCAQAATGADASGATVHHGVACDICGATPLVGVRYKSTVKSDYDVCTRCFASPAAAPAAPYIPLGFAGSGGSGGGAGGGAAGLRRQQLPPSGSGEGGGGGDGLEAEDSGGEGGGGKGGGKGPAAPRAAQRHAALMQWVWDYFSQEPPGGGGGSGGGGGAAADGGGSSSGGGGGALAQLRPSPVTVTRRAPLYLQHEGHSRTIVGVERYAPPGRDPELKLLILDPGMDAERVRDALSARRQWQRLVKRGLHALQRPEFQILYVADAPPAAVGGREWEALKRIAAAEKHYS